MRIGIASDSSGNVALLGEVLLRFARAGVDRAFFLGGGCADVDAALALRGDAFAPDGIATRILRVASGSGDDAACDLPRKQVDLVEGLICCLVHDKAELTRDDIANASVIFHGNTAAAALVQIGARTFVTPGRLGAPAAPGQPATYGIVEVTEREIVLAVHGEDGAELRRERAALGAGGKLSVR